MRKKNAKRDKPKKIIRRQPIVDREVDFTRAVEYSPPIRTEKYQIKASKAFNEVQPNNYPTLFVMKCEECSHIFDFQKSYLYRKQIEIKSTLLIQLINGFENTKLCQSLRPQQFNSFLEMIRKNIFRALPNLFLQDLDANDLNWPHLTLIYCCMKKSLFLSFYSHISQNFLYNLIRNAASYDIRERACVRDIMIELFSRYKPLHMTICKCISSLLSINICSNELFQIISFISCKFNYLNAQFFIEYVLPIHLLPQSAAYQSLMECDLVFTKKDPNLFPDVFQYLLNHWPITNQKKYPFFLKIIVKIFELFINGNKGESNIISSEMANAFFDAVSLCSSSEHVDAAAYALHLISQPLFQKIYQISLADFNDEYDNDDYSGGIDNVSFQKLCQSVIMAENHWDETVRSCALDAMLALSISGHRRFEQIHEVAVDQTAYSDDQKTDDGWNKIFRQAKRRYRSIKMNM